MKRFILVLLPVLMLLAQPAFAQQDATYSQFMYNGLAINPGYAGSAETFSATALYRKQWINIEGAPETQTLTLDAPVYHRKLGLGLSIVNDKIGVTSNLNVNGIYAYRIRFENFTLSMGLQTGVNNYKANYASVVTSSQHDVDNSFSTNINRAIFNFGTGLYLYSKKFFAGISVPHIINQQLDGELSSVGARSRQYRHYFLTGGYVFDAGEKFKVKPSALFKFVDGAPLQLDVNTNIWYNEKVCLGFSYRTNDSFSTLLQLQIAKQVRIGYAYDYLTSKLNNFSKGNNELMVSYRIPPLNSKIITPRFF